jgi:menaquinone-9 beta-reductase
MAPANHVLVIGGGIAGAALAIQLSSGGHKVTLVEKTAGPHHKVCGEFLSYEALRYLAGLGIDLVRHGAVPIRTVCLAGRQTIAEAQLPFAALSLSRQALDEALLMRAAECGALIVRGRRVQTLVQHADGLTAQLDSGEQLTSKAVFLATGKHDLHGWKRPPGKQNDLVAFKMHWRLTPAQASELAKRVELLLFTGGYGGLEPVEDGMVNLCLLVRRDRFAQVGGRWQNLLAAMQTDSLHLARRLAGAVPCWERPLALSSIPYGYVCRRDDGVWRLGDQAAVIPSLAGDGMAIALHSAQLAADEYLSGGTAETFRRRLLCDVMLPVSHATKISRALLWPPTRNVMEHGIRLWPGLLRVTARLTRIAHADLVAPAVP